MTAGVCFYCVGICLFGCYFYISLTEPLKKNLRYCLSKELTSKIFFFVLNQQTLNSKVSWHRLSPMAQSLFLQLYPLIKGQVWENGVCVRVCASLSFSSRNTHFCLICHPTQPLNLPVWAINSPTRFLLHYCLCACVHVSMCVSYSVKGMQTEAETTGIKERSVFAGFLTFYI